LAREAQEFMWMLSAILCRPCAPAYIKPTLSHGRPGLLRLALIFVFALLGAPATAQSAQKVGPQNPRELHISFAPVVKKVRPAVVNVYA
jgi:S1-C subfamily serine protease